MMSYRSIRDRGASGFGGQILVGERERAENDRLGAGPPEQRNGLLPIAAIGGDDDTTRLHCNQATRFAQPVAGARVEALPLHADRRPEKGEEAQLAEMRGRLRDGGVELQHEAGGEPRFPIGRAPPRRCPVLAVDAEKVRAGFRELADLVQQNGVVHHEMDLDRQLGDGADARHEIGKEQERRREMPIGDIDWSRSAWGAIRSRSWRAG